MTTRILIAGLTLLCILNPHASAYVAFAPLRFRTRGQIRSPIRSPSPLYLQHTLDGNPIPSPLTPLSNHVFVIPVETLRVTSGGMFLPDQSVDKPTSGRVIARGEGRLHPYTGVRIPNAVEVDENVLYGRFDGTTINYDGDDVRVIRDDDVILIYEGDEIAEGRFRMAKDYVLLKLPPTGEGKTSSGIAIAKAVTESVQPCKGIVVSVGEGRTGSEGTKTEVHVKVGEEVKFRDYAGNDVVVGGEGGYVAVRMVDILSKIVA